MVRMRGPEIALTKKIQTEQIMKKSRTLTIMRTL